MIKAVDVTDKSGCSILNTLKFLQLICRKTGQQTVTIVQPAGYKSINQNSHSSITKKFPDSSDIKKMKMGSFTYFGDMTVHTTISFVITLHSDSLSSINSRFYTQHDSDQRFTDPTMKSQLYRSKACSSHVTSSRHSLIMLIYVHNSISNTLLD